MIQPNKNRDCVVADLELAATEWSAQIFDCWNTIGVSGNGSCRELLRFTHCRNCPVYSAAAAQLLDRPVIPRWRDEWTEHFAKEKQLSASARTSVVIFRIGPEWLALPTPAFQEVAEHRVMHTLPHRRKGLVLGLVNIRGELLICVSLGRLLGLEESKVSSLKHKSQGAGEFRLQTLDLRLAERLLVTNWDGNRLVFPVDEVHGIRRMHNDEFRDPPATIAQSDLSYTSSIFTLTRPVREGVFGGKNEAVSNWANHTVGLLNAEVIFATLNRTLA